MLKYVAYGKVWLLIYMEQNYNNIKVEYLNQETRLVVDMNNSAEAYLKRGITKEVFFNFVSQIVDMMDKGLKCGIQAEYDLDKMEVENDKVIFRTQIGKSELNIQSIKNYLKELAYKSVFQGNDFLQTLYEYLAFMDSAQVNSIDDIKRQLHIWLGNKEEEEHLVQAAQTFSIQSEPKTVPVYENDNYTRVLSRDTFENENMQDESSYGETGVLDPSFWNNMMQANSMEEQPGRVHRQNLSASLHYIKTGEKVNIDKANFTVGKGADANYIINNVSISRFHAKIVCQNGQYYVIDNESTNGTYVNGRRIEPNIPAGIKSGDLLRLANEEFKFYTC